MERTRKYADRATSGGLADLLPLADMAEIKYVSWSLEIGGPAMNARACWRTGVVVSAEPRATTRAKVEKPSTAQNRASRAGGRKGEDQQRRNDDMRQTYLARVDGAERRASRRALALQMMSQPSRLWSSPIRPHSQQPAPRGLRRPLYNLWRRCSEKNGWLWGDANAERILECQRNLTRG